MFNDFEQLLSVSGKLETWEERLIFDELSEAVWDKLYVNAACNVCVEGYAAERREAYLLDVDDKYPKPQVRAIRRLDVAAVETRCKC